MNGKKISRLPWSLSRAFSFFFFFFWDIGHSRMSTLEILVILVILAFLAFRIFYKNFAPAPVIVQRSVGRIKGRSSSPILLSLHFLVMLSPIPSPLSPLLPFHSHSPLLLSFPSSDSLYSIIIELLVVTLLLRNIKYAKDLSSSLLFLFRNNNTRG